VTYLEPWYTHAGYLEAIADYMHQAGQVLGHERAQRAALVYTAHSIPEAMAAQATYTQQFTATAACDAAPGPSRLPPGTRVRPMGRHAPGCDRTSMRLFGSGLGIPRSLFPLLAFYAITLKCSMTSMWRALATARGDYVRAQTVGTHPAFMAMLSALIAERLRRAKYSAHCPPVWRGAPWLIRPVPRVEPAAYLLRTVLSASHLLARCGASRASVYGKISGCLIASSGVSQRFRGPRSGFSRVSRT
jgi:hypothetical protein